MARFTAYVYTNKVGSDCKVPFEVDDKELEGLTEHERNAYLDEVAEEALNGSYEWGWTEDES